MLKSKEFNNKTIRKLIFRIKKYIKKSIKIFLILIQYYTKIKNK